MRQRRGRHGRAPQEASEPGPGQQAASTEPPTVPQPSVDPRFQPYPAQEFPPQAYPAQGLPSYGPPQPDNPTQAHQAQPHQSQSFDVWQPRHQRQPEYGPEPDYGSAPSGQQPPQEQWPPREQWPQEQWTPQEQWQQEQREAPRLSPGALSPGAPSAGALAQSASQPYDFESFYRPRPVPGPALAPSTSLSSAALPSADTSSAATYASPPHAPPVGPGSPPLAGGPVRKRRRRWVIAVVVTVLVLILGAAGAGGGYLLLRTHGTPGQTAASYLNAWQRADYRAMQRVSVHVPASGLAGPLTSVASQLGVKRLSLKLGAVAIRGNSAVAHFTVTEGLASGHVWTYQDQLPLLVRNRHWRVSWSPSGIYPGLKAGERFSLSAAWPARGQILAADGTVLSSPAAVAESGSIALLTGYTGVATAAQAKALGAPYRKGDVIGIGGIEQAYQAQLAGRPSLIIKIVGPGRRVYATAKRFAAKAGKNVRTSIEMAVQLAASAAVSSAKTSKPVDMVVVQPSTGRVLAVVERPGGFDRALQGIFPPGSTFKVITASALINTGLTPASSVQCPSQVTVDGRTFHNNDNEHYGTISFQTAFAVSCNSTFIGLATQRLTGSSLANMARKFGFNATPELGIPVTLGQFTTPHDPVDLGADAFGQGTDLVNPLSQATVAAAVDDGTWRPPLLVISPKPHQVSRPHVLSPTILNALRPMMRAVVTSGTAAGVGFPPGVYGKTGTAQFGNEPNQAHGWFIGYQGDIAFAVLVEDGGYGANSAGPIANAFLRRL
jgi:hypothetical protein